VPFFKFGLARFKRANPNLKKAKFGWWGGFTQGGGLPPSSDYGGTSGGLALGYYHAAPRGAAAGNMRLCGTDPVTPTVDSS
jgi:hypothetical protein